MHRTEPNTDCLVGRHSPKITRKEFIPAGLHDKCDESVIGRTTRHTRRLRLIDQRTLKASGSDKYRP